MMSIRSIYCSLLAVLICSVPLFSQGTPITVTSSHSSGSSSSATMINGKLVSGHCAQSKNGVASGCGDPTLAAVPDVLTTVTPGFTPPPPMPGFPPPPPMPGFGQFPPIGGFHQLSPIPGFDQFPPIPTSGAIPGFGAMPEFGPF